MVPARVPLVAPGDDGIFRPTCALLQAVAPSAAVPSPDHALRVCSLLRDRAPPVPGFTDRWVRAEVVLAAGVASPVERAALLCGFLLGFGLDAFVAVGDAVDGPDYWCLTRDGEGGVAVWDARRGVRYPSAATARPGATPFRCVHAVIGPGALYVNGQGSAESPRDAAGVAEALAVLTQRPLLHETGFDLEDPRLWRKYAAEGAEVAAPLARVSGELHRGRTGTPALPGVA